MRADDDGFIGNPKKIMRMIGASEDDLKILLAKRFLIIFEDSVVVVKHWWMHNTLAKDRYHETSYTDEKALLRIKENKSYTLGTGESDVKMLTECNQNVNADIGLDIDLVKDKELDKDIKPKQKKEKFGTYLNVLLTETELKKLIEELGQEKTSAIIRNFSELKEMKGYKYKSDYLAIKKWGIRAYEESQYSKKQFQQNNGFDKSALEDKDFLAGVENARRN